MTLLDLGAIGYALAWAIWLVYALAWAIWLVGMLIGGWMCRDE